MRLALDRGVIDPPWGLPVAAIAHVWPEPRAPGGWTRVAWPSDAQVRRFVAPLDLQIGHVLEVTASDGWRCYGWVADADANRFVVAPARDAASAVVAAARAVEIWHTAELAAVEDAWRARIARVHRMRDEVG